MNENNANNILVLCILYTYMRDQLKEEEKKIKCTNTRVIVVEVAATEKEERTEKPNINGKFKFQPRFNGAQTKSLALA